MPDRNSEVTVESTFMRFEVELNIPGFDDDGGDARAAEVKRVLTEVLQAFDGDVKVTETTE